MCKAKILEQLNVASKFVFPKLRILELNRKIYRKVFCLWNFIKNEGREKKHKQDM
jgi:hypothetical protein